MVMSPELMTVNVNGKLSPSNKNSSISALAKLPKELFVELPALSSFCFKLVATMMGSSEVTKPSRLMISVRRKDILVEFEAGESPRKRRSPASSSMTGINSNKKLEASTSSDDSTADVNWEKWASAHSAALSSVNPVSVKPEVSKPTDRLNFATSTAVVCAPSATHCPATIHCPSLHVTLPIMLYPSEHGTLHVLPSCKPMQCETSSAKSTSGGSMHKTPGSRVVVKVTDEVEVSKELVSSSTPENVVVVVDITVTVPVEAAPAKVKVDVAKCGSKAVDVNVKVLPMASPVLVVVAVRLEVAPVKVDVDVDECGSSAVDVNVKVLPMGAPVVAVVVVSVSVAVAPVNVDVGVDECGSRAVDVNVKVLDVSPDTLLVVVLVVAMVGVVVRVAVVVVGVVVIMIASAFVVVGCVIVMVPVVVPGVIKDATVDVEDVPVDVAPSSVEVEVDDGKEAVNVDVKVLSTAALLVDVVAVPVEVADVPVDVEDMLSEVALASLDVDVDEGGEEAVNVDVEVLPMEALVVVVVAVPVVETAVGAIVSVMYEVVIVVVVAVLVSVVVAAAVTGGPTELPACVDVDVNGGAVARMAVVNVTVVDVSVRVDGA